MSADGYQYAIDTSADHGRPLKKYPIMITPQLPVKEWHPYIGEPTIADAIMDRLTATNHRFDLKGESLRKK
ncbi:ATP-binding protein [Longitalea luteola]|uniref:ATP-binding protein n=1 Tax=Longitalea luteola TaxID=2812563 RepID=UPI0034E2119D